MISIIIMNRSCGKRSYYLQNKLISALVVQGPDGNLVGDPEFTKYFTQYTTKDKTEYHFKSTNPYRWVERVSPANT